MLSPQRLTAMCKKTFQYQLEPSAILRLTNDEAVCWTIPIWAIPWTRIGSNKSSPPRRLQFTANLSDVPVLAPIDTSQLHRICLPVRPTVTPTEVNRSDNALTVRLAIFPSATIRTLAGPLFRFPTNFTRFFIFGSGILPKAEEGRPKSIHVSASSSSLFCAFVSFPRSSTLAMWEAPAASDTAWDNHLALLWLLASMRSFSVDFLIPIVTLVKPVDSHFSRRFAPFTSPMISFFNDRKICVESKS